MRKLFAICVVLALVLAPAGVAVAKQSAKAKAIKAVKEEIGNEWLLLKTVPKRLKSPGAHVSVICKGLSKTRFRCSFTASHHFGPHHRNAESATGEARVKVFPHGAEAILLRAKCVAEADGEVLPGLTCS